MNRVGRWLAVAGATVHLLATAPAGAQQIPTDESGFSALVAEQLRKEMRDVQVVIKAPLTLSIGSAQTNLDRVYAFCKDNADDCSTELRIFVQATAETTSNRGNRPTRAALRVVVRPNVYFRYTRKQPNQTGEAWLLPDDDRWLIVPVLDSSGAVRQLDARDRAALGPAKNQIGEIAIANLRRSLKPLIEVAKPVPHGQFGSLTGDYCQTSRLALVRSWAPLAKAQDGVLIVAVPAVDVLLYSSEDSSVAVDALRALTRNVMSRSPKPLSDKLLRWTAEGWGEVP